MTGTVFVHVGLPKTATTTLQKSVFPLLASDRVIYEGVLQPRNQKQSHLYRMFCSAVNGQGSIACVRAEVESQLSQGLSLILSEEMFTSSQGFCSWRMKLENLGKVVQGLNYQLIVSIREPSSALFSYYAELYHQFSSSKRNYVKLALEDEALQIFHYGKLAEELMKSFEERRIHFIKFEDIIHGRLDALIKIVDPDVQVGRLAIQQANNRKSTADYVVTTKSLTLLDVVRRRLGLFYGNGIIHRGFSRVSFGKRKVCKPSVKDARVVKDFLIKEVDALEKRFGFDVPVDWHKS